MAKRYGNITLKARPTESLTASTEADNKSSGLIVNTVEVGTRVDSKNDMLIKTEEASGQSGAIEDQRYDYLSGNKELVKRAIITNSSSLGAGRRRFDSGEHFAQLGTREGVPGVLAGRAALARRLEAANSSKPAALQPQKYGKLGGSIESTPSLTVVANSAVDTPSLHDDSSAARRELLQRKILPVKKLQRFDSGEYFSGKEQQRRNMGICEAPLGRTIESAARVSMAEELTREEEISDVVVSGGASCHSLYPCTWRVYA
jgi:hypothetical protein